MICFSSYHCLLLYSGRFGFSILQTQRIRSSSNEFPLILRVGNFEVFRIVTIAKGYVTGKAANASPLLSCMCGKQGILGHFCDFRKISGECGDAFRPNGLGPG